MSALHIKCKLKMNNCSVRRTPIPVDNFPKDRTTIHEGGTELGRPALLQLIRSRLSRRPWSGDVCRVSPHERKKCTKEAKKSGQYAKQNEQKRKQAKEESGRSQLDRSPQRRVINAQPGQARALSTEGRALARSAARRCLPCLA